MSGDSRDNVIERFALETAGQALTAATAIERLADRLAQRGTEPILCEEAAYLIRVELYGEDVAKAYRETRQ